MKVTLSRCPRLLNAGVASLVLATVAAGCASNGGTRTNSTTATSLVGTTAVVAGGATGTSIGGGTEASGTETTVNGGSDPVAAGLAAAKAFVEPYLSPPTKIGITDPLHGTLQGKTVMFLECSAPNCKEHGDLMEKPLQLLGATFKRVPAGGTPEEFAAAYDTAIAQKPDVVLSAAINNSFVSKQLDQLEAMGIPVISQATGEEPTHGVDKEMLSPGMWKVGGRAAAAYITVDSGGAAKILYIKESIFTFANPSYSEFESALKEYCPKCTLTKMEAPVTDVGTAIPGQVVSAFQTNPKLNYITDSYGAQTVGVNEALAEAHIGGYKLVNQAGVAYNIEQVLAGGAVADMQVSEKLQAWVMVDAAARAVLGQDLAAIDDPKLPWIFFATKDNINWDPKTDVFEGVVGLEDQFKKLWGVS